MQKLFLLAIVATNLVSLAHSAEKKKQITVSKKISICVTPKDENKLIGLSVDVLEWLKTHMAYSLSRFMLFRSSILRYYEEQLCCKNNADPNETKNICLHKEVR